MGPVTRRGKRAIFVTCSGLPVNLSPGMDYFFTHASTVQYVQYVTKKLKYGVTIRNNHDDTK